MKLLHTADWHIDVKLAQIEKPRLDEHKEVLDYIVSIIESQKIDILLISGDIFHRPIPSFEAEKLFAEFVVKVSGDLKVPIFGIAGNHDSAMKVDSISILFNKINHNNRLLSLTRSPEEKDFDNMVLNLEGFSVAGVPYLSPYKYNYKNVYRDIFEKWVRKLYDRVPKDNVLIFLSHDTVADAKFSGSEYMDASEKLNKDILGNYIDKIVYWALGHIHEYQKIEDTPIPTVYPGSIIKVDFGEKNSKKYVVVVEIEKKDRMPSLKPVELPSPRNLEEVVIYGEQDLERFLERYKEEKEKTYFKLKIDKTRLHDRSIKKISELDVIKEFAGRITKDISESISGYVSKNIKDPIKVVEKYCQEKNLFLSEDEKNKLREIIELLRRKNEEN